MATNDDRHDPATVQMSVYVNRNDKDWVTEQARKSQMNKSDYMRFLIAYARSNGLTLNVGIGKPAKAS